MDRVPRGMALRRVEARALRSRGRRPDVPGLPPAYARHPICKDLVHPPHDVLHRRQVAEADLGGDPALVADVEQGLADGGPVDLALAERVVEPLGLGVFLDVDLEDPLAQLADPLLRDSRTRRRCRRRSRRRPQGLLELVDVAGELDGAEEELVPDLLDRDLDAGLLGVGDQLADVRPASACRRRGTRPSC